MSETDYSQESGELEEIWSLFAQEGRDYLSAAEKPLLQLEQDSTDVEQIKTLFRALHSFKGAVRMMGLSVMESLAHHAEDLIALVRDEGVPLQTEMIDLILAIIDRLRVMMDHVLTRRLDVDPDQIEDMIESLQHMIARSTGAICAASSPSEPVITSDPGPTARPSSCALPVTGASEVQPSPNTSSNSETVLKSHVTLDPEWQYLLLQECRLRQEKWHRQPLEKAEQQDDIAPGMGSDFSAKALGDLIEAVGELMADHATQCSIVNRLDQVDLVEEVLSVVGRAKSDAACIRRGLLPRLREWTEGVHTLSQVQNQMSAALTNLQQSATALRLAPVSEMLNPLRRMVQDLARDRGKLVNLDLQGTDLQLDRKTMQILTGPICRLVSFAVTHGIENVEHRSAQGKSTAGRVSVQVNVREDHALVAIEDDGRGIDEQMVKTRARELGWIDDDTPADFDLILRPGFGVIYGDAADGGVDLAALRLDLGVLHGRLSVKSAPTKGTRFEMRIPQDLAVVDGMVVRVGEVRYVVPVNAIKKVVLAEASDFAHFSVGDGHSMLRFEDGVVQIRDLRTNWNGANELTKRTFEGELLVIVDGENGRTAFPVDQLLGRRQVLVRPLQGHLADTQHASGCALLGEGEVGIVLGHV